MSSTLFQTFIISLYILTYENTIHFANIRRFGEGHTKCAMSLTGVIVRIIQTFLRFITNQRYSLAARR